MAQQGYRILFAGPARGPDLHRIRNFAEDLHRELIKGGFGLVPDLGHTTAEVLVRVRAKRHLAPTLRVIRLQLARSNFDDNVSVERLSSP
jgi:hypothetical protein